MPSSFASDINKSYLSLSAALLIIPNLIGFVFSLSSKEFISFIADCKSNEALLKAEENEEFPKLPIALARPSRLADIVWISPFLAEIWSI